MDGASGHLKLMGRDCSRPSPQASFSLCLVKLNYYEPKTDSAIYYYYSNFQFSLKMVKWELALVDLSASKTQHSTAQNLSDSPRIIAAEQS